VEAGLAPDVVGVGVEGDALAGDGGIELGEGVEVSVDDGLLDVGPQCLGRLEFGRVGWEMDEAEAIGHGEAGRAVPAGVVEHEHDDPLRPGARPAGEERERVLDVARGKTPVERCQKLSPVAGETKAVA
jgi:hypothetical protein